MSETKQIKKWHWIVLLVIVLLAMVSKFYAMYWPKAEIKIAGQEIKVILADNQKHRIKGLAGRDDLGEYGAMLFVYSDLSQHGMSLSGVKFPVDIIWINGREIVDIAPSLWPTDQTLPYFARGESNLVLELPAGFVEKNKIKIGDSVEIKK